MEEKYLIKNDGNGNERIIINPDRYTDDVSFKKHRKGGNNRKKKKRK
jgi:hypothetical protein